MKFRTILCLRTETHYFYGMNVLLLGSGGREHAMAWKLSECSMFRDRHIAPGNGGMHELGILGYLDAMDLHAVERYVRSYKIDLRVVGSEATLVARISYYFRE